MVHQLRQRIWLRLQGFALARWSWPRCVALLRRESSGHSLDGDFPDVEFSFLHPVGSPSFSGLRSGGGGDFGGGGASGDFSDAAAPDAALGVGEVAGGVLGEATGADEGAIVVGPVVAVFLIGVA